MWSGVIAGCGIYTEGQLRYSVRVVVVRNRNVRIVSPMWPRAEDARPEGHADGRHAAGTLTKRDLPPVGQHPRPAFAMLTAADHYCTRARAWPPRI